VVPAVLRISLATIYPDAFRRGLSRLVPKLCIGTQLVGRRFPVVRIFNTSLRFSLPFSFADPKASFGKASLRDNIGSVMRSAAVGQWYIITPESFPTNGEVEMESGLAERRVVATPHR
jgi:hypothetical protein